MTGLNITPLSVFFSLFTLGYLVALLYVAFLERRHARHEDAANDHVFSLIVPARNEDAVLGTCIRSLLSLDYPADKFEILVVDDNSTDGTSELAEGFIREFSPRVETLRVPEAESGRGKAAVLNYGYRFLRERSRFRTETSWIIGVFDADGSPDRDMLAKASFQFRNAAVGGIQAAVRIRNRDRSWLTRMQDVEFAGFARMTQIIRSRIVKSASLGGNGQFVRARALDEVAADQADRLPWDPEALTEDLELATRMALRNWDMYQLDTSQVWQEGVEDLRSLIRQRTRWAWGSLQVFERYVLRMRILRTPGVRWVKRLDLLFNLSMFLVSPLVLITWILSAFAFAGLLSVSSAFPWPVMFLLSFGYFPVVGYGLLTSGGYRPRDLPLHLAGFAIYTYHWVPCLYIGAWRIATHHTPIWHKTAKSAKNPSG